MNKVIITGFMANDPESRTTSSGIATCSFRVAVQRRFADKNGNRESDFLTVVCWRQTAEFVSKYLHKGRRVAVEGSIQTRSYEANDGSKRYVTEIVADNIEALDKAETKSGNAADTVAAAQATFGAGFTEVVDDELPF
jgi:single-strand DNA-binding protein